MTVIRRTSHHNAAMDVSAERLSDWRDRGACREADVDPEIFFPVRKSTEALAQERAAKQMCGRCPVSAECLQWALDTKQKFGVWGGVNEDDREVVGRRAEYARARNDVNHGQALALERGVDVILARTNGQTEQDIAEWAGVRTVAVRYALRILLPDGQPPRVDLTALERALLSPDTLLTLIRADRTDREIASMLRVMPGTIANARIILSHREVALGRLQADAA